MQNKLQKYIRRTKRAIRQSHPHITMTSLATDTRGDTIGDLDFGQSEDLAYLLGHLDALEDIEHLMQTSLKKAQKQNNKTQTHTYE